MRRTETIIVGGGQAGLAMSRCLGDRGVDHVVLERGEIAERWRNERWHSLRMLTPRWQSRLPGWSYRGSDPDGYMTRLEVVDYLTNYARSFAPPIHTGVTVHSIRRCDDDFIVTTNCGSWRAPNVVLATGYCDRASVPAFAASLPAGITQVVPTRYRGAAQLPSGNVLVVGASATGIQLASEIAASGRGVTLSVGRHIRLPRRYRGRDILTWFDAIGMLSETTDQVPDIAASRSQPSLQLVGSDNHRTLDLDTLQRQGVRIVGRALGAVGSRVYLADDLAESLEYAQAKMYRQLARIDRHVSERGLGGHVSSDQWPLPIQAPRAPESIDLTQDGIQSVVWATGYRRDYSWLHLPVLDGRGELIHEGGVTPEPGLYALGLNFMRRRNSSFLDGVGRDAEELADHLVTRMADRQAAVAC